MLETGVPRCDVAVHRDGFLTTAARGDAEADAGAKKYEIIEICIACNCSTRPSSLW